MISAAAPSSILVEEEKDGIEEEEDDGESVGKKFDELFARTLKETDKNILRANCTDTTYVDNGLLSYENWKVIQEHHTKWINIKSVSELEKKLKVQKKKAIEKGNVSEQLIHSIQVHILEKEITRRKSSSIFIFHRLIRKDEKKIDEIEVGRKWLEIEDINESQWGKWQLQKIQYMKRPLQALNKLAKRVHHIQEKKKDLSSWRLMKIAFFRALIRSGPLRESVLNISEETINKKATLPSICTRPPNDPLLIDLKQRLDIVLHSDKEENYIESCSLEAIVALIIFDTSDNFETCLLKFYMNQSEAQEKILFKAILPILKSSFRIDLDRELSSSETLTSNDDLSRTLRQALILRPSQFAARAVLSYISQQSSYCDGADILWPKLERAFISSSYPRHCNLAASLLSFCSLSSGTELEYAVITFQIWFLIAQPQIEEISKKSTTTHCFG